MNQGLEVPSSSLEKQARAKAARPAAQETVLGELSAAASAASLALGLLKNKIFQSIPR